MVIKSLQNSRLPIFLAFASHPAIMPPDPGNTYSLCTNCLYGCLYTAYSLRLYMQDLRFSLFCNDIALIPKRSNRARNQEEDEREGVRRMDIFEVFMRGVVWVSVRLGMLVGMVLQQLYLGIFRITAVRPVKETRLQKSEADENRRLAGCESVVNKYATAFGYIARECISRDELRDKIDNGISPEELEREILRRIWEEKRAIILGTYTPDPNSLPVKLPFSWRDKHVYIVGRSGSGKTNIIKNMVLQDLELGNGIGVLAPELELLTEGILPYIPEHRLDDVVFVNPADTSYPIPFNPLQLDEGENIGEKVDDAVTIFKRMMEGGGSRMDEILWQSLYALIERPGSTLLDFEPLLNPFDDTLRKEIARTSRDQMTRDYFASTYPALISAHKDAHLPITNRIRRLVRQEAVRTLLCQPGKSFNFRKAMDEGKILLFNLSDGMLGVQTSHLLGQLIVSKIQLALMSRADTPASHRKPFYLYLDEFQAFVGVNEASYATILSRARKYAFGLILAHQQTGQLSRELLHEILGNVSTILTFGVSSEDAKRLSQEYRFQGEQIPPNELIDLRTGQAWGKIGNNVFPLHTYLADQHPDFRRAKYVVDRSRRNYGDGGDGDGENGAGGTGQAPPPPRRLLPPNEPPDPAKVF